MTTSTSTPTRPRTETVDEPSRGLDLGVAQVAASALAAVSASLAASFLGVAGTILGAGLGAVVATVGSAVYAQSLRRATERLRDLHPAAVPAVSTVGTDRTRSLRSWLRGLVLVAIGAAVALGGITVAEGLLGHPVSTSKENGTSIGRAVTGSTATRTTPSIPTTPTQPSATAEVTTSSSSSSTSTTVTGSPSATVPTAVPTTTATAAPTTTQQAPSVAVTP